MKKIIILIALMIIASLGCQKDEVYEFPEFDPDKIPPKDTTLEVPKLLFTFNDIDGNVYHAIQIGDQIWSQENLRTTRYNDGTSILHAHELSQWQSTTTGAYCHCTLSESGIEQYGLLYNYHAATHSKLAPEGWHVATYDDWMQLLASIGIEDFEPISNIGKLIDQSRWDELYTFDQNHIRCSNSTGFSALPNGYRNLYAPYEGFGIPRGLHNNGNQASWWTSGGVVVFLNNPVEENIFSLVQEDDIGAGVRIVKDTN